MLTNLREILKDAMNNNYIIPGFNVFGYEDASAVIKAGEKMNAPIVLLTHKAARKYMPISYTAPLFKAMAEKASIPVCLQLEHAKDFQIIEEAIELGYTSVMYDGSQLPLEENIRNTKKVIQLAHSFNVSVEAEIGSVAYEDIYQDNASIYTCPLEAEQFVNETKVDALAIAIGTVHRQQQQSAHIQYERLSEIEKVTNTPLVLHGSSGISHEDLSELSKTKISKVNIGTALRTAFGDALKEEVLNEDHLYNRKDLFKGPMEAVQKVVMEKLSALGF
ncbi:class II fructose-bisphosphate aldolase [Anaeromicrobium sediminis]|uniref:Fructose-bisphosphate aldolase n=1 Tax=Anaeromicrobium sediminis TaxID=1478221 RepID=A0A267MI77_9FIRM|nr:class II fructose-bisphosphate aldolase [Anaeromicrobium sediminis]PAB59281.1 fructose-bisphosphate aldolase [Anaeromicrobium sediminis]